MAKLALSVRIVSPQKDIYKGMALSVSSINSSGKFDILPEHANFLTLVANVPITIKTGDGKNLSYNFPLAIIHATANTVNIYTDLNAAN